MKTVVEYKQIAVTIRSLLQRPPFDAKDARAGLLELLEAKNLTEFDKALPEVILLKNYLSDPDLCVSMLSHLLVCESILSKHDSTLGIADRIQDSLIKHDFIADMIVDINDGNNRHITKDSIMNDALGIIHGEPERLHPGARRKNTDIDIHKLSNESFNEFCDLMSLERRQFDLSPVKLTELSLERMNRIVAAFALSKTKSLNLNNCFIKWCGGLVDSDSDYDLIRSLWNDDDDESKPYNEPTRQKMESAYIKSLLQTGLAANITSLILANNPLDDFEDIWQEICAAISSPKLRFLDVSSCHLSKLDNKRFQYFCSSIQRSGIEELICAHNDLFENDERFFSMLTMLRNPNLKSLSLAGCELSNLKSGKLSALLTAINQSNIEFLDLSNNDLSSLDEERINVLAIFIEDSKLRHLSMNTNGLFDVAEELKIVPTKKPVENAYDHLELSSPVNSPTLFRRSMSLSLMRKKISKTNHSILLSAINNNSTLLKVEGLSAPKDLTGHPVVLASAHRNRVLTNLYKLLKMEVLADDDNLICEISETALKAFELCRPCEKILLKTQKAVSQFARKLFDEKKFRIDDLLLALSPSHPDTISLRSDYIYSILDDTMRSTPGGQQAAARAAVLAALPYCLDIEGKIALLRGSDQITLDTYLIESFAVSLHPGDKLQLSDVMRVSLLQILILTKLNGTESFNIKVKSANNSIIEALNATQALELSNLWKTILERHDAHVYLPAIRYTQQLIEALRVEVTDTSGLATLEASTIYGWLPANDKGRQAFFKTFPPAPDVEYESVRLGVLNSMQEQFLQFVTNAEMKSAEAILKLMVTNQPMLRQLLTINKSMTQENDLIVTGTALEIALKCWDWSSCEGRQEEMAEMIMRYICLLPEDEGESLIKNIFKKLFPNGITVHQEDQTKRANEFAQRILEPLAKTLFDASDEDITLVFAITRKNDHQVDDYINTVLSQNKLWQALMSHHKATKEFMKNDVTYNPYYLLKAFEIVDRKYEQESWSDISEGWNRSVLLTIHGAGVVQACSPAIVRMLFARNSTWHFYNMDEDQRAKFKVPRDDAHGCWRIALVGQKYWASFTDVALPSSVLGRIGTLGWGAIVKKKDENWKGHQALSSSTNESNYKVEPHNEATFTMTRRN